jgi:hypothetical protein
MPRRGEPLAVLDIDALAGASPRLRAAVKRLAQEQTPQTVAQLVLWHLGTGLDWSRVQAFAHRWANPGELALARRFVSQLEAIPVTAGGEAPPVRGGFLDIDLGASGTESQPLAAQLHTLLDGRSMLGLTVRLRPVEPPHGPAIACQVRLESAVASVRLRTTDESGTAWRAVGAFSLPLTDPEGAARSAAEVADTLAQGVLDRLVRVELSTGPRVTGKATYKIRLDNLSPLVLNGLALAPSAGDPAAKPSLVQGIGLPPRKHLAVPASAEAVERLGLKKGIRVLAAAFGEL